MAKIIDYCLITASEANDLDEAVCKYIRKDWQPFGGVAINEYGFDDTHYSLFAQAMVKYAEGDNVTTT